MPMAADPAEGPARVDIWIARRAEDLENMHRTEEGRGHPAGMGRAGAIPACRDHPAEAIVEAEATVVAVQEVVATVVVGTVAEVVAATAAVERAATAVEAVVATAAAATPAVVEAQVEAAEEAGAVVAEPTARAELRGSIRG
jgi:hypothetical protein